MNNMRSARKSKNLTMKQLGSLVGVSEGAISQYETGKREPSYEILLKIGEVLDVSVSYLLGVDAPRPYDQLLQLFGSAVNEDEQDLIQLYRQLDDKAKALIKLQIHGILDGGEK